MSSLPRTAPFIRRRFERYHPVFWGKSILVTDGVRKITCGVRNESLGGLGLSVAPLCPFQIYEPVTIQSGMLRRRARFVYFDNQRSGVVAAGLEFLSDSNYS
jgi:hypothetical protein